MATLHLLNTLTRRREEFQPLHPPRVGLYSCGPTVYWTQHLGNFRAFTFVDVLKRVLRSNGLVVRHVMNITDVGHLTSDADEGEDKLEAGARREGLSVLDVAAKYTAEFQSDFQKLNLLPPDVWSRATEHIPDMIALSERLVARGHTYETSQALYFDVTTSSSYGRFAGQSLAAKKTGGRAAVVTDPEKKHPADFALWFKRVGKFAHHQMHWASPWGDGFPGWHLECSAMSMKYLGEQFDLHAGGIEHIPIHHTNEIAQSEGATGKEPFVRVWLHNEHLIVPDGKMAKSLGNVATIADIERRGFDPLAFRYVCLLTHYRKPLTFSWPALEAAATGLRHLQLKAAALGVAAKIGCAEFEQRFREAVNDDLNTPAALAVVHELLRSDYPDHAKRQSLLVFDEVLGLKLDDVTIPQPSVDLRAAVQTRIDERDALRKAQRYADADRLREEMNAALAPAGFTLEDTEDGPVIAPLK